MWLWITVQFSDMLSGMRAFRKLFLNSLTPVSTLALGIGAVTAMFSIYSQVVLNPVTVPRPETVLTVYGVNDGVSFVPPSLSWPRFQLIQQSATAFRHVGAYSDEALNLSEGGGKTEQIRGERVSGEFFSAI